MEMARTRIQKGERDCAGNTRMAGSGKKRKRKAEGDVGTHYEAGGWRGMLGRFGGVGAGEVVGA